MKTRTLIFFLITVIIAGSVSGSHLSGNRTASTSRTGGRTGASPIQRSAGVLRAGRTGATSQVQRTGRTGTNTVQRSTTTRTLSTGSSPAATTRTRSTGSSPAVTTRTLSTGTRSTGSSPVVTTRTLSTGTRSTGSTPRLIGLLIPRRDGRAQIQLMPGARQFLGPGRRITAARLSQLRRLGVPGFTGREGTLNIRSLLQAARRAGGTSRGTATGPTRRRTSTRTQRLGGARGSAAPNVIFVRPPSGQTNGGSLLGNLRITGGDSGSRGTSTTVTKTQTESSSASSQTKSSSITQAVNQQTVVNDATSNTQQQSDQKASSNIVVDQSTLTGQAVSGSQAAARAALLQRLRLEALRRAAAARAANGVTPGRQTQPVNVAPTVTVPAGTTRVVSSATPTVTSQGVGVARVRDVMSPGIVTRLPKPTAVSSQTQTKFVPQFDVQRAANTMDLQFKSTVNGATGTGNTAPITNSVTSSRESSITSNIDSVPILKPDLGPSINILNSGTGSVSTNTGTFGGLAGISSSNIQPGPSFNVLSSSGSSQIPPGGIVESVETKIVSLPSIAPKPTVTTSIVTLPARPLPPPQPTVDSVRFDSSKSSSVVTLPARPAPPILPIVDFVRFDSSKSSNIVPVPTQPAPPPQPTVDSTRFDSTQSGSIVTLPARPAPPPQPTVDSTRFDSTQSTSIVTLPARPSPPSQPIVDSVPIDSTGPIVDPNVSIFQGGSSMSASTIDVVELPPAPVQVDVLPPVDTSLSLSSGQIPVVPVDTMVSSSFEATGVSGGSSGLDTGSTAIDITSTANQQTGSTSTSLFNMDVINTGASAVDTTAPNLNSGQGFSSSKTVESVEIAPNIATATSLDIANTGTTSDSSFTMADTVINNNNIIMPQPQPIVPAFDQSNSISSSLVTMVDSGVKGIDTFGTGNIATDTTAADLAFAKKQGQTITSNQQQSDMSLTNLVVDSGFVNQAPAVDVTSNTQKTFDSTREVSLTGNTQFGDVAVPVDSNPNVITEITETTIFQSPGQQNTATNQLDQTFKSATASTDTMFSGSVNTGMGMTSSTNTVKELVPSAFDSAASSSTVHLISTAPAAPRKTELSKLSTIIEDVMARIVKHPAKRGQLPDATSIAREIVKAQREYEASLSVTKDTTVVVHDTPVIDTTVEPVTVSPVEVATKPAVNVIIGDWTIKQTDGLTSPPPVFNNPIPPPPAPGVLGGGIFRPIPRPPPEASSTVVVSETSNYTDIVKVTNLTSDLTASTSNLTSDIGSSTSEMGITLSADVNTGSVVAAGTTGAVSNTTVVETNVTIIPGTGSSSAAAAGTVVEVGGSTVGSNTSVEATTITNGTDVTLTTPGMVTAMTTDVSTGPSTMDPDIAADLLEAQEAAAEAEAEAEAEEAAEGAAAA